MAVGYGVEGRMASYGSSATYGYGADGLRAWKSVGGVRTYFLYDGGVPVAELDALGSVAAANVFAPDGLVARQLGLAPKPGPGPGGTNGLPPVGVRYGLVEYCFDLQGSASQRLDSAGGLVSASAYDAYGQESATAAHPDPFDYNGRSGYYHDAESGLHQCQNRYYDARGGRWLTRDPIGFAGGANLYGYCGGGPVGSMDPSGHRVGQRLRLAPCSARRQPKDGDACFCGPRRNIEEAAQSDLHRHER